MLKHPKERAERLLLRHQRQGRTLLGLHPVNQSSQTTCSARIQTALGSSQPTRAAVETSHGVHGNIRTHVALPLAPDPSSGNNLDTPPIAPGFASHSLFDLDVEYCLDDAAGFRRSMVGREAKLIRRSTSGHAHRHTPGHTDTHTYSHT
jgi:hypothetical protein